MRVLYLLRYFPTLTETFVYREIDALRELGVEVIIAALGRRSDGDLQGELPRAQVLRVPRHPIAGRLAAAGPGQRWLSQVRGRAEGARLAWLRQTLPPVDRLHAHFAGGAAEWARALALDLGIPWSVTVHAVDLFKPRPSLDLLLAEAHPVVTVARHHQALLAERGARSSLVRCGPDLARWDLGPPPDGPLHALAVGRNVPKKGLDLLLAAWSELDRPQARLTLVSDMADPGMPGVTVTGLLPPAGVREAMSRANTVVLPCRRAPDGDMDGVPVSLMEGLAASRPAISTTVSGIPELVDTSVGWLLPPEDPAALVDALRAAHDDPAERRRRGARGPARLAEEGFSAPVQARRLLAAWTASGA